MLQLTYTPALKTAVNNAVITKAATKRQQTEKEIRGFLVEGEKLAIKHECYVAKYVTKANLVQYQLLGEILAFTQDIFATNNVDKVVREMRKELTYVHKIKTQKNSTPLAIIVRYVTRTTRKNALIYSQVLSNAISANIKSADLPDYIKNNGGMNKICEKASKQLSAENAKKLYHLKTYYARKLLEERAENTPYAEFEIDKKRSSELHDVIHYGEYAYFVCQGAGHGKFKVIDAIAMDPDLENRLMERYFAFEQQALIGHCGAGNVESYLLGKFKEAIEKDNAIRSKGSSPLLDKFGYEIK
ncbi:hypothetical protein G6711_02750 [Polynucleobacter paneuropaeus]|jgi:hypothetical protein|nr:hypothetical protein [Polynucleobacter paneuropaeus]